MLKQAIVAENELTLSYKLKLKPTREQALFLEDYFIEFSKAVNFFLKAILTTMNQFEVVPNREQVTANCSLCAQVVPLQWRMKATGDMVCQRCCRASYDRKVFYATRGRKRGRFDFRDCAAKISGTDAARAYDVASDTLRGLEQRRRQLSQRIARQRQELRMWQEVLHDVLVEDEDGNLVSARFARERKPNQRTDRYVHYYWRDTRRRGRSLASIRGLIRKINKEV